MKPPNLRIIEPCPVIIPVQTHVVVELLAVVCVAVFAGAQVYGVGREWGYALPKRVVKVFLCNAVAAGATAAAQHGKAGVAQVAGIAGVMIINKIGIIIHKAQAISVSNVNKIGPIVCNWPGLFHFIAKPLSIKTRNVLLSGLFIYSPIFYNRLPFALEANLFNRSVPCFGTGKPARPNPASSGRNRTRKHPERPRYAQKAQ